LKKGIAKVLVAVTAFALLFSGGCGNATKSASQNTPVIRVAQQGAYDTWATYELHKTGMDKKNGFDLQMTYYDSGPQQIEALAADQWDIAAVGAIPALVGALKYDLQIIGIADDESLATTILARPDNPVFKTKGFNPAAPDVYGNPQDIKGKNVFVTTITTGHVLLLKYLQTLGLTEQDIKIMNMEQPQMLSAFESGKGDMAVMWSPFTYTGLDKGWKVVADGKNANAQAIIYLVASKKFTDAHPELVTKFLESYISKQAELKKDEANQAGTYKAYLKDWSGLTWDDKTSKIDMEKHLVYNAKEQLDWLDNSKGPSKIEKLISEASDAFTKGGKFTSAEREQIIKFKYLNTTFLKNLAK
jgi:sulfonate transport system substrate-binding protein